MTSVTITDFDRERKITCIKFLRSLTRARDDRPVGLREAKLAVDALSERGTPITVVNVPTQLLPLVDSAAIACHVEISAASTQVL